MGRKSKLTEEQWAQIGKRRIDGESRRSLAKEFGISETSIREREEKLGQAPSVQRVASMLVEADAALKSLPISAQISAQNLADKLRSISESYASVAELGARTAHRLHALANAEVAKVDDSSVLSAESLDALKGVGVLTRLGNEALLPATNLLSANKETIKRINDEGGEGGPAAPVFNLTLSGDE